MRISYVQANLAAKALYQPTHRFKDLYRYVRDVDWLTAAALALRTNVGARTPGIDGVVLRELSDAQVMDMVGGLARAFRKGVYRPAPALRTHIPKQDGSTRQLGISTARDRVVQEVIRMVLEPIYESVFLDSSFGFRPNRSVMDAIKRIQLYANEQVKMFWIVQGNIKGCFDQVPHRQLLGVLRNHVADEKLLALIKAFLRAGYLVDGKVSQPNRGTLQGGVVSPLLANIYVHEMDKVWWERYGGITSWAKQERRRAGLGNVALVRYADDFVLMTNGPKAFANELEGEFREVLAALALSEDDVQVSHVNDGFDFLGFRIQRRRRDGGSSSRKALYVVPTTRNMARYKDRIRTVLTETGADVANKLRAVNAVSRGWATYYRHVQSTRARRKLAQWTYRAFERWLVKKHRPLRAKAIYSRYYGRTKHNGRKTWVCHGVALHDMGAVGYRPHMTQKGENPYLKPDEFQSLAIQDDEPVSGDAWRGTSAQNRYAIGRWERMATVGYKCEDCGRSALPSELAAHHVKAQAAGGKHERGNLRILCPECHQKTPSYGRGAEADTT
jgi:group II intron reverse transcriptase/maturase